MTDFTKAAADARILLRGFQGLADVAAALDAVALAEQTRKENELALTRTAGALEQARIELAALNESVAQVRARAKLDADAAQKKAADKAAKTVADSEAKAAASAAAAQATQESARLMVSEANAELASVKAAVQAASDELALLNQRIENAKAEIARMLGGK